MLGKFYYPEYPSLTLNVTARNLHPFVYLGTLYIYCKCTCATNGSGIQDNLKYTVNSNMTRSPVVISSITALYLVNVVQAVSQWVWFDQFFLLPGQSNYAAYLQSNAGPHWILLISQY